MKGLRKPISEVIENSFNFYSNLKIDTTCKTYALAAHLNILYYLRINFLQQEYKSEEINELEKEINKAINILEPEYQKVLGLPVKCTCPVEK